MVALVTFSGFLYAGLSPLFTTDIKYCRYTLLCSETGLPNLIKQLAQERIPGLCPPTEEPFLINACRMLPLLSIIAPTVSLTVWYGGYREENKLAPEQERTLDQKTIIFTYYAMPIINATIQAFDWLGYYGKLDQACRDLPKCLANPNIDILDKPCYEFAEAIYHFQNSRLTSPTAFYPPLVACADYVISAKNTAIVASGIFISSGVFLIASAYQRFRRAPPKTTT